MLEYLHPGKSHKPGLARRPAEHYHSGRADTVLSHAEARVETFVEKFVVDSETKSKSRLDQYTQVGSPAGVTI